MRTPQRLKTKAGETYFRVRYRRDGKQRALTFYGPRAEDEARQFARILDTMGADRAVAWWNSHLDGDPDTMTVDAWFARHLDAMTGITDGTRLTYRRVYERVWAKPIGRLPLDGVTREHIATVVNQLSAVRSDKTVKNAYGIIATAFKTAVRDGHIPDTPCKNIRLPRRTEHEATEMRFLTHDEWAQVYAAAPEHYRPLFTFLIGTGMRWGEVEALQVRDIKLTGTAPVVHVTKAVKWDPSKSTRQVGPPKTKRSRRTVTLPPEVVDEVAPLLASRAGTDPLFTAPRGGPLRHRTVYDDWKRTVAAVGLEPQPRIHDLRHTHVAWLIAAGIPLPAIQARLGHESITTTVDRYGHLMPDLQQAMATVASVAMSAAARPALPPGS